jgi:hypothetical protein
MARARVALTVVALLLLLASCGRLEGDLTINGTSSSSPDTVSGTMLVAVSDEWAISQGQDPDQIGEAITEELAASPEAGLTGQPYDQDGFTGATLAMTDLPLERLTAATQGALEIARDGNEYVLRGDLADLDPTDPQAADDTPPWTARFSITFPERVTEHNGTLDGRTVSWDLTADSPDTTVYAVSSVGPVSWLERVPWWLVAIVVVLGLGAAAAFVVGRRRQREQMSAQVARVRERHRSSRGPASSRIDDVLGPGGGDGGSSSVQGRAGRSGPRGR